MEDDLGNSDLDVNGEFPVADGVARWVPAVVVIGAVVGFVALAWYAYHAGTQSISDDNLMVVEADKNPEKEKPVDPGGMKFPDQDKTIFDTFSNNNGGPPKVERVMPAPEEPMAKQQADNNSETTTWVNNNPGKPEQMMGEEKKKIPAAPPPIEPKLPDNTTAPVEGNITSYTAPKTDLAPAQTKNESTKAATPPKPFMPPPIAKAAVKSAKTPAFSGSSKIQLGAYRSEQEASAALVAIQKKFPALAGKVPVIVKADLGDKGIYYRLRVGGFSSAADGKAFCSELTAKGQACIPVD